MLVKKKASPPSRTQGPGRRSYFRAVADARFVIRRVLRLVDERAKQHGLEPVEHQALIQIYGARSNEFSVGDVAERLFISAAFGSRLAKVLLSKGFIKAQPSRDDQRVVHLTVTPEGADVLTSIDREVRLHVDYFTRQLSAEQKDAAIAIFAFYVGTSIEIKGHSTSMEASLLKLL